MSLIRLHDVTKRYDDKPVLRDIFFRLSRGDRAGLIGKNGTGKTTALRLILGQEEPTAGTVEMDEGVGIGYFSQFSELSGEATILEVLDELFADVHAIQEELLEVEIALEESPLGAELDRLLNQQAALVEEMNRRDLSKMSTFLHTSRAQEWPDEEPDTWHIHEYHFPEADLERFIPELQRNIKEGWYIHAFNVDTRKLYVILKGKSFLLPTEKDDSWDKMIS